MAVPTARERNALRVLDYLFREGPARRVDVIRATALSRATVSKLIGELQAQGLVVEQRPALNVAGRSGRPPTRLTLNPQIGAFGGVDFGHSSVRVAIADVTGALVAEDRLDLDVDNAAELAITAAVERLPALVAQAGLARKRLLGVGAAISAPVRRDGASVVTAGMLVCSRPSRTASTSSSPAMMRSPPTITSSGLTTLAMSPATRPAATPASRNTRRHSSSPA